ncbi:MAG: carbon monoxide dehydrogenase beta subunit family protein [Nitrososphaerota archaeon]|nr:CO dehydrogenase/acetyl-CoA synthase complex subunit epsilon [Candidatus Bathyarchaeota archaeon]MCX8162674.1 CO dehydrogenase/acetyl-CoA synthase complex subunit epsilon [Candidatus Bathyarchaeota archaeon]MDW8061721.1 carbon monoxide dehydrogenase beta subunit family protein [Nitrososphaerota archaeon]
MYRFPEPWATAEIPGPKKAAILSRPESLVAIIKRSNRRLLAVGSKALDKVEGIDIVELIRLLSSTKLFTIVASRNIAYKLEGKGIPIAASISVYELGDRLRDGNWTGFDGGGKYGLTAFIGFPYITLWLVLSGLKHFAPSLSTVSLDPYYQPHASWSLPNVRGGEWYSFIKRVVDSLEVM